MTNPVIPEGQGPEVTEPPVTAPEPPANNAPPWADDLATLPESVRPLVEPLFKKWDTDVTQRFQSLHSEYEPYKSFIDEYEAESIGQALAVMQALEANPQQFIQQAMQAYGIQSEQGMQSQQPVVPDGTDDDDPYNERFTKLEGTLEQLATILLGQQEQSQQAQQQQELDTMLEGLKAKHGEFDEFQVLSLMYQGLDPDKAVTTWKSSIESYAQKLNAPIQQAPTVVGQQGGGYPQNPIQPQDLDDKARKDLVVQMLAAAAAQQQ